MVQATLTDWTVQPDGRIKVTWLDGHSNLFLNLAEVQAAVATLDSDPVQAELYLIGWFLARSPDGSNVNLVEGKRLTLDLAAANPIRVQ